ncbi:DUF397 domain-containing protein [Yinghuangia soli]|uniref:DUF397 domain-containing protein n=1 Tax=Yinghuangia soli TaxID=2908204 RepID=A0AA41U0M2_9ACTN|nr:DUF397 domain-containing protein [Yinghuangia soli]MCF2526547.1 DUF397 domain-containing protein [Yinghuangia soli]
MKRITPDVCASAWRKSSYSNDDGGACVEVADGFATKWRKSSYSNADGGACVEVADGFPVVPVRDSKDPARGMLTVAPSSWAVMTDALKAR